MPDNDLWEAFKMKESAFSVAEETQKVRAAFDALPSSFQPLYEAGLQNATAQTNGPDFIKHSLAVWFEMSRLNALSEQNVENISPEAKTVANPEKIEFQTFVPPGQVRKNKRIVIQNDIPVERDGKPFAYEAKYLPARPYGTTRVSSKGKFQAQHHDQILKYQKATEIGLVAGAAVEIQGRIDPKFLKWLYGAAINKPSPAPDVQIIYSLPLPSGEEYRATIKRADK